MKYILEYKDIEDIFANATIWTDEYELYWFQYAWSLLEKEGVTTYSTSVERYQVILYAFGLIKSYYDFCEAVFDESNEEGFVECVNNEIPEMVLGQLYAKIFPHDDLVEDRADALDSLINSYQYRVNKAIRKHITESEIFVWMYCSADIPFKYGIDDDGGCEETPYEINSFEDYKAMIADASYEMLNDPQEDEMFVGFEYVRNKM